MRRPALAVLLLAGGCAQIAGIDETSSGSGTVDPARASITLAHTSIGATLTTVPQSLSGLTAEFLLPSDTAADGFEHLPAETLAAGVWSTATEAAPYVMYDSPDLPVPTKRLFMTPFKDHKATIAYFEHPNPTPVIAGATLTVSATLPTPYAATEALQIYSVGAWFNRGFGGVELPVADTTAFGPVTFSHDVVAGGVNSLVNRPLEAITSADAILLLRYVANRLTGAMTADPFDQTGADTITGTMTAVAATDTMTITLNNATVSARYMPLRPAMPAPNMVWSIVAAPAYDFGSITGPQLEAAGASPVTPSDVTINFGNPFADRGWKSLMGWRTGSGRVFTPAGAVGPVTLSAGINQFVEASGTATLDQPAALPELVTLGDKDLSTDGVMFAQPTKAVDVTVTAPATPATDLYQINLYELVPNATNDALGYQLRLAVYNTAATLVIPAQFFEVGKSYTIRAHCYAGGFPKAGQGDFAARSVPFTVGYLDSGVFTVTP